MSVERLSRLQKWILKELYALTEGDPHLVVSTRELKGYAWRLRDDWAGKKTKHEEFPTYESQRQFRNILDATFSRSIQNMSDGFGKKNKALVSRGCSPSQLARKGWEAGAVPELMPAELMGGRATCVGLTDKGREVARDLLNVKKPGLNDKENDNG